MLKTFNKSKVKTTTFLFSMISSCIFLIFSSLAMIFYEGGNSFDPNFPKYDFLNNFFSDLGRVTTFTGKSNQISFILFTIALTFSGFSLIPAMVVLPSLFLKNSCEKTLSVIGSIFGIIAGISYVGIAFTPWDLYLGPHLIFVYISFTCSMPLSFLYALSIFRYSKYKNFYAYVFMFLGISLSLYLVILFAGPDMSTESGRLIQVFGQKFIVYIEITCFLIESYGGIITLKLSDTFQNKFES